MSKKLNILIIPKWYPNSFDKMFGLFAKQFAENISNKSNVIVIYIHIDKQIFEKNIVESIKYNLKEYIIYLPYKNFLINFLRRQYYYFIYFMRVLTKYKKIDLIHLQVISYSSMFILFIYLFYKVPYIITEHWSKYFHLKRINIIEKLIFKYSKKIFTVSNCLKEQLISLNIKKNIDIIANSVNENIFVIKNVEIDRYKFVHISCFDDKSKNISGIVEAIKILKEGGIDVKLHIIGIGKDYEKILKQSSDYQLTNRNIFFEGELNSYEISEHFQNSNALIMNSNYETFGIPIAESLMTGCRVITTKVGFVEEYCFPINSVFIIEKNNSIELSHTIEKLINNFEEFNKLEIRNFALANFSNSVIREKYFNHIYNI